MSLGLWPHSARSPWSSSPASLPSLGDGTFQYSGVHKGNGGGVAPLRKIMPLFVLQFEFTVQYTNSNIVFSQREFFLVRN